MSRLEKTVKDDCGVSFEEFRGELLCMPAPDGAVKMFRRITLSGKTRFVLKEADVFIDENFRGLYTASGSADYLTPQEVFDSPHPDNPLQIAIQRSQSKSHDQRVEDDDPAYYQVLFFTYTDMWFERTAIGSANRNRLRDVFGKLFKEFEVVATSFTADGIPEEYLENVVFGQD